MMMGTMSTVLLLLAFAAMRADPARNYLATKQPLLTLFLAQSSTVQPTETQQTIHPKCDSVAERANQQAEEMVPGRIWTWALDAERSLQQLDKLRQDLTALRECEATFEASLSASQPAPNATAIRAMAQLSQHLERDVQSLDDELRKGHPRRWHVAHDAQDMQKEIQSWRRLHETVWAGLQAK